MKAKGANRNEKQNLLLGGCIGVVFMCCLQINRLYKTDSMKKEVEANEKKNC